MSDRASGSEAARVAIQTERDGLKLYEQAAQRTSSAFGKRMFLSLAEDERSHVAMLNDLLQGAKPIAPDAAGAVFRGKIKTVFMEVTDSLKKRLESEPDHVEAVKTAMDFEEQSCKFYENAAIESRDEVERELFRKLAEWEHGHWAILEDTHIYFTDPELWNSRDNPPLLDGG